MTTRMRRKESWRRARGCAAGFALMCIVLLIGRLPAAADTPTFARDIAPIVFQQCVNCHRPDEVAPFSLLTYADAQKRARQIADVTAKRIMPPWKLDPNYGAFKHARRLTETQIATIQQWAAQGAPEGNKADQPPAPKFTDGWQLGKPDMILKMPRAFAVPAEGKDVNRSFVIPVHLPADKYIRATEIRPGDRRVAHHATIMFDNSGKARQLEAQQGGPGAGYVSFGGPGFLPVGGLPGYVPGTGAEVLPDDASGVLPKDIDLVLGMHYHPYGREAADQTSIGLYFTDKPPQKIGSLIVMGVLNLDIAPGEKDHLEEDTYTLPVDVEVESVYQHMHLIGKSCKLWAELPDHSIKPIIKIDDWDFNWQSTYHVKERYRLPKGAILHGEWMHDNSADNPANPNHPPKRVTNGEDYVNEMAGVLLNVYVDSERDNGVIWIANLGHLGAASTRPPAHHRAKQRGTVGAMLLGGGYDGLTEICIGLIEAPLRTMGVLLPLLLVTWLSALLIPARLFPHSTLRAANTLAASPLRGFGIGLLALAGGILVALPLLFSPNGGAQGLGALFGVGACGVWLVGMGGLTQKLAQRLARRQNSEITFATLTKSSLLLTGALCFPILGWFVVAPLAGIAALGAGLTALWPKRSARREAHSPRFQSQPACV